MIDLQRIVDSKLDFLRNQIKEAEIARDMAAPPTESHSDKSRQIAEQLVHKYQDELGNLLALSKQIKDLPPFAGIAGLNSIVTLRTPMGNKQFLIVPEGLGGSFVDDIFLLSQAAPLAQNFLHRKPGFQFEFNGNHYEILFIHKNT